jgi:hypothetical protein
MVQDSRIAFIIRQPGFLAIQRFSLVDWILENSALFHNKP